MRELLRKESWLSPREVVTMATRNGAQAVGQSDLLGKITPAACADLIALPGLSPVGDIFETIVAFKETVPWVMVNGSVVSTPTTAPEIGSPGELALP
jgi:imidazolonepropionase-like amidohydrolase